MTDNSFQVFLTCSHIKKRARRTFFCGEHLSAPCPDGARSDVGEPPINKFPHLNHGRGKECRSKGQISETGTNLLLGSNIYHEAIPVFVCLSYCGQFKARLSLITLISHGVCQHTHARSNTLRHTHVRAHTNACENALGATCVAN